MNVLHIINNNKIGGAQKIVYMYKNNLTHNILFLRYYKDESAINFTPSCVYKISSLLKIKNLIKFIRTLHNTDVFHIHLYPSIYVSLLLIIMNKKVVFTQHSYHKRRFENKFIKKIDVICLKKVKSVICISEHVEKYIKHKSDLISTTLIHNPVHN